jgi:hypothetical protein
LPNSNFIGTQTSRINRDDDDMNKITTRSASGM